MNTIRILFSIIISLFIANISIANNNDCVILLHGLARTNHSMSKLASTLNQYHYVVVNDTYPSTKKTIHELAEEVIPPMINQCLTMHPKHIHFVTHSLGGIILQQYLQHHPLPELEYIVMLAPPNHGSPMADQLQDNKMAKLFFGPTLTELTTHKLNPTLVKGKYKIGIIAGNYSGINPLAKWVFHEPNDGSVAVSSTQMKNMDDFIVLPVSHTFIMQNKLVREKIIHFLAYGTFST